MAMIYNAPIQDMKFILNDVFEAESFWQNTTELEHVDMATVEAVLETMAKFSRDKLLPLNRTGDEEGATYLGDGQVKTPEGFKAAFDEYAQGGWIGLGGDPNYGGQGMPKMVTMLAEEMVFSTNQSFTLYPNLSVGASMCLLANGSEEQKQTYVEKIYNGQWSGTMCLTEPHAGTDLGIIKTKALPQDDGSYTISGTKIFITGGEHDLTENIIHLVLAKTPDAPAGSKGISLFIVPKFLVNDDGSLGERNSVSCGSIEHKMGIKASATCVMNFDGAKGWMVGAENTGLAGMFVMMNYERLTMGLQGLGGTELAYQNAAQYACDRSQGRSTSSELMPQRLEAHPIVYHPDVRRMLLNVRAHNEASRCFAMYVAKQLDTAKYANDDKTKKVAANRVALLTPIAKGFLTDKAFEASVDAQQVLGGHGYIREWGLEQIVRDNRIAQIYEGTNGIQALDLAGRKVVRNKGAYVETYLAEIREFVSQMTTEHAIKQATLEACDTVADLTQYIIDAAGKNSDEINGGCVDYMHAFGYLSYGYMFALMVEAANGKDGDFYTNKAKLADYFVGRVLPRINAHAEMVKASSDKMMDFESSYFNASA